MHFTLFTKPFSSLDHIVIMITAEAVVTAVILLALLLLGDPRIAVRAVARPRLRFLYYSPITVSSFFDFFDQIVILITRAAVEVMVILLAVNLATHLRIAARALARLHPRFLFLCLYSSN